MFSPGRHGMELGMSMTHSHRLIVDSADSAEDTSPAIGAGLNFSDPDSPLAPYYLQAGHVFAVVLLGAVFLFFTSLPLWHTDIWGHLDFGRWILQHRCLPDREPFCQFSDPQPESLHSCWLSQAVWYGLYHCGELLAGGDAVRQMEGGVEMLRVMHALLAVLRCGLFLAAFRRLTGSMPLACAGVGLLLLLSPGHFSVLRPQMFGEVIFAGLVLALSRPVLSVPALLALPALMALWANLHGSFLIGLALMGACLAGRGIEAIRARRFYNPMALLVDPQVQRLFVTLALSAAAIAVLNPDGPSIYEHTFSVARHPNIATMDEWKPLDFSAKWGGHWPYLASVAVLVISQFLSPRWYSPTAWLLILGLGLTPCLQQRMMVWWVPVVPWVVLPLWQATGQLLPWTWLHHQSLPTFKKTLLAGTVVALAVLWSAPVGWLLNGRPRPLERSISAGTPWELAAQLQAPPDAAKPWLPALAEQLRRHYPDGRFTGGVFASESEGDYLVWALPPEIPVAVYTHAHLFTPEYWKDCLAVRSGAPRWGDILDHQHINLLVVESELHPQLRRALHRDPAWQIVLDEKGDPTKRDERCRLLIALRTEPMSESE
jgi:hypothetical protein